MKINRHMIPAVLVVFALALRLWGLSDLPSYENDERFLIPATFTYLDNGHYDPDSWEHPPLKYYLLTLSMKIFGNNAYGWRMKNVVLGALSVLVLFLIGRALFEDPRIPFLAALLLVIDPLHIYVSRLIHEEISGMFFFLLAVYLTILYLQNKMASPILAGACAGFAIAQKWYFALPLLTIAGFALLYRARTNGLSRAEGLHIVLTYSVLPFTIYLLPFTPWFHRGYSFNEFLQMQLDAYNVLQEQFANFNPFLRSTSSSLEWFIKPLLSAISCPQTATLSRYAVFMNNPPVWLLTFPAFFFFTYKTWQSRDRLPLLLSFLFLTSYLQFALVDRVIFLYSALIVVPYAFLFIAYLLTSALDRLGGRARAHGALAAGLVAWGLYVYPLVTGRVVPMSLYAPLTALGSVYTQ